MSAEQAKEDARKLADDMREGADRLRKGAEDTFKAVKRDAKSHFSQNYNYMSVVHQLRSAQLIALVLQVNHCSLGFLGFLFPVGVILANVGLIGQRWYHRIDGRKDVHKIRNSSVKPVDKVQRVFGPFVLAFLANSITPAVLPALCAMFYRLLAYLAILIGAGTAAIEFYEAIKEKTN